MANTRLGKLDRPVSGGVADQAIQVNDMTAKVPDHVVGRAAGENFPVALRLVPARRRRMLLAAYWFARVTDDTGDTGPPAERLGRLDDLEADVTRLADGTARRAEVRALAPLVAECGVPVSLFADLIQANRQDQIVSRYETFEDLLGYCRLSANPVGRIVLHIFGAYSPVAAASSDRICTALQLVEHWQDVAEDYRAGRIYLPGTDLREFGCAEADLAAATAAPSLRSLIAFQAARAGGLMDEGAPLIGTLRGSARAAVAGYVAGGRAALAALAAASYDVLGGPPRPRRSRLVRELAVALVRGR